MKKFQFKFEALEKIRQAEERKALQALGEAQKLRQEEERKKQKILESIFSGLSRREELGKELTSPLHFQIEEEFIIGNKYRLLHADQAIFRAQRKVNKAMEHYLEKRQKLKMMERLRSREKKKYDQRVLDLENKELDELYLMRDRLRRKRDS